MYEFESDTNREPSSDAHSTLGDTLSWAFELDSSPAIAGATWLTREIVPNARDPFEAILDAATTVKQLEELKTAYKMLRTTGTTMPERNLAARLYAATIAAALVRHNALITRQSDAALTRAFEELYADDTIPERIRMLATLAADAPARRTGNNSHNSGGGNARA